MPRNYQGEPEQDPQQREKKRIERMFPKAKHKKLPPPLDQAAMRRQIKERKDKERRQWFLRPADDLDLPR